MGDIAIVDREFSIFRDHIKTVSRDIVNVRPEFSMFRTDNPSVKREFSMFRNRIPSVKPDSVNVTPEFSIFLSASTIVTDKIAHSSARIVGCGADTRGYRIDNGIEIAAICRVSIPKTPSGNF
jgi:hypothetical protein